MTPERWRQVTEMFHAAAVRPVGERRRFLEEACADDDDLRAEVGAMLTAHEGAADTPHVPVMTVVHGDQELEPGDRVGPHQVLGLIAAGGMGEVYRARDSRLDREVAVKVLPDLYAADPDRLRRFEQEARVAGALTHPNLLTVYDVGLDGGRPYLVTELLDGETLRDRLKRGPMPASRACDVAAALARGLAAAHAKGIVHRDLKPENVIVTRDGRVKIVDFGVAKLRGTVGPVGRGDDERPSHTESGSIVGTPGYMAPEQVRGTDADGRADVFALGAILFELLTGRPAFERTTRAETLEATLNDDPMASSDLAECPLSLRRIAARCLEKDEEARFQSAADLAFALAAATESVEPSKSGSGGLSTRLVVIVATLLLAAGVVGARTWLSRAAAPAGDQLARFALPFGARVRFTGAPAISPDGTTIVYPTTEGPVESQRLFVRRLDQVVPTSLPGTEGAASPASPILSPDGTSVAFWSNNALKRTRLDGTASPVVVCHVESFLGGAWTTDGTIVFASNGRGLRQVAADGGVPRPLTVPTESELDHRAPTLLPGGRAMLLTVHESERRFRIDVLTLDTGERRSIVENGFDARYISTGHVIYAAGTALFAVPFDLSRLRPSGPAVQLLDGVSTNASDGLAGYALSDTGTLVFLPQPPAARRTLAWVDRTGNTTPLPLEPRAYWTPRISPDGRQVAVVVEDQDVPQIWVHHLDNGTFARLTSEGRNWAHVWSRDGAHVVHASEREGRWLLVREPLDGRDRADVLATSTEDELVPGAVSADDHSVFYVQRAPSGGTELRVLDVPRGHSSTIADVSDRVAMPVLSPDGRWLGFTGWTPLRPSLFVRPAISEGPIRQLSEGSGYTVWSHDGRAIYFRTRRGASAESPHDGVFELPFDPVRGVVTGPERQLFRAAFAADRGVPAFDIARDGRFLLVLADERESFPRDPHVLLHVDDELKRRAPVIER